MHHYPSTERGLQGDVRSLQDVEKHILPHLDSKRVAIQAGGAAGLWAHKLAGHFEYVFSFEPNPELRECFKQNVKECDNILLYPYALGKAHGRCRVFGDKPHNMGSWWVQDGDEADIVPMDDFAFSQVDLIMLDVEGSEIDALKGATDTILNNSPAIVVEVKPQCLRKFGYEREDLYNWLKALDYRRHSTFHGERDELWLPIRQLAAISGINGIKCGFIDSH